MVSVSMCVCVCVCQHMDAHIYKCIFKSRMIHLNERAELRTYHPPPNHPLFNPYLLAICVCFARKVDRTSFPIETNYLSYYFTIRSLYVGVYIYIYMFCLVAWFAVVCSRLSVCLGHTSHRVYLHICMFHQWMVSGEARKEPELTETTH